MEPWILLAATAACSQEPVVLSPVWSADQPAVIAVLGEDGRMLLPEPVLVGPNTGAISFDVPRGPLRLHARAFAPERAAELMSCGVVAGAGGARLPAHEGAWVSPLFDPAGAGGVSVTLEPDPAPVALDLRFRCDGPPCEVPELRHFPFPERFAPERVLAVSERTRYVTSGRRGELIRLEGNEVLERETPSQLDFVDSMAVAAILPRPHLWGISTGTAGAALFSADDSFSLIGLRSFPGPAGVASIPNGALYVHTSSAIFTADPTRGIDAVTPLSPALDPVAPPIEHFEVVSPERMLVLDRAGLMVLDRGSWRQELRRSVTESIKDLAADEISMMLVGRNELVRVRNGRTREWEKLPVPFDEGVDLTGVVALGRGRYLVVGDRGKATLYNGTRWCPIDPQVSDDFARVSVSPMRYSAVAVGPELRVAVRFDFPQ